MTVHHFTRGSGNKFGFHAVIQISNCRGIIIVIIIFIIHYFLPIYYACLSSDPTKRVTVLSATNFSWQIDVAIIRRLVKRFTFAKRLVAKH